MLLGRVSVMGRQKSKHGGGSSGQVRAGLEHRGDPKDYEGRFGSPSLVRPKERLTETLDTRWVLGVDGVFIVQGAGWVVDSAASIFIDYLWRESEYKSTNFQGYFPGPRTGRVYATIGKQPEAWGKYRV